MEKKIIIKEIGESLEICTDYCYNDKPFEITYELRSYEIDPKARLTPVSIFNYLTEAAYGQSASVGLARGSLRKEGLAWFLNRFHFQILKQPQFPGKIHIQTYLSSLKGLYAIR